MFWDILYPHRCVGCGQDGAFLCSDCAGLLPQPFPYHDRRVKKLIHLLKYRFVRQVARDLAPYLHTWILEELSELRALHPNLKFLLVPIPLHEKRKKKRGFNQAAELARALAARQPEIFDLQTDLLIKIKDTQSQTMIKKRTERLKNIAGAFAVKRPEAIQGRVVIVLDDVITTGGTMREARRALKAAGAKKVLPLTLAQGSQTMTDD